MIALMKYIFLIILISCGANKENLKDQKATENLVKVSKSFFEARDELKTLSIAKFKTLLTTCPYYSSKDTSCSIEDLPFLSKNTLDEINSRIIVSKPWMRTNFMTVLNKYKNQDLLYLFKSIRGIVISHRLPQSFFMGSTGFIYLKADLFASTEEEKDNLLQTEDRRVEAYNLLPYIETQIYSQKNKLIQDETKYREIQILSVLYHELSHAVDYFPKSLDFSEFGKNPTTYTVWQERQNHSMSQAYNRTLKEDRTPNAYLSELTNFQNNGSRLERFSIEDFTSEKVAEELRATNATVPYGYTTRSEFLATIMEAFFMYKNHQISSTLLFLTSVKNLENEYSIEGGFMNRILLSPILKIANAAYLDIFNGKNMYIPKDDELPKELTPKSLTSEVFDFETGLINEEFFISL